MARLKHYYELPVYKKCRLFRIFISKIIKRCFPKDESYNLKTQLLRSSRSVTANIAEGFGRFHFQENIQFCRQARGSLTETLEHLITARDEGYIDEEMLLEAHRNYTGCLLQINGYIKLIQTYKNAEANY